MKIFIQRLFVGLFLLILFMPAAGMITGLMRPSDKDIEILELRKKEKFSFTGNWTHFLQDNLVFRQVFVDIYTWIMHDLLGNSPDEKRVVLGQDGFLFLGDFYANTYSFHTGLRHLTAQQKEAVNNNFSVFFRCLNKLELPAVLAIAPDKASLYHKYYPPGAGRYTTYISPEKLRLDNEIRVEFAPILKNLLGYQDNHTDLLYFKTDSHWNPLGAYIGYEAVMEAAAQALGQPLKIVNLTGKKFEEDQRPDHDLGRLLRRQKADHKVKLQTEPERKSARLSKIAIGRQSFTMTNPQALNPQRVLIINDSFYKVNSWLYELSFRQVTNIHISELADVNLTAFLSGPQRPDLVIVFIVERDVENIAAKLERVAKGI